MRSTRVHDEGRPAARTSGARALLVGVATATAAAMVATGGLPAVAADAPTTWKFDLGTATSPVADGYQQVTDATRYSAATGFGIVPADGVTPDLPRPRCGGPGGPRLRARHRVDVRPRRAQRHVRRDGPLGRPARGEQHHQDHGDPRRCGRRLAEHQGGHRLRHLARDGRRRAAHRRDHRQRCGRLRELDRRRADGHHPRGAGARHLDDRRADLGPHGPRDPGRGHAPLERGGGRHRVRGLAVRRRRRHLHRGRADRRARRGHHRPRRHLDPALLPRAGDRRGRAVRPVGGRGEQPADGADGPGRPRLRPGQRGTLARRDEAGRHQRVQRDHAVRLRRHPCCHRDRPRHGRRAALRLRERGRHRARRRPAERRLHGQPGRGRRHRGHRRRDHRRADGEGRRDVEARRPVPRDVVRHRGRRRPAQPRASPARRPSSTSSGSRRRARGHPAASRPSGSPATRPCSRTPPTTRRRPAGARCSTGSCPTTSRWTTGPSAGARRRTSSARAVSTRCCAWSSPATTCSCSSATTTPPTGSTTGSPPRTTTRSTCGRSSTAPPSAVRSP